MVGITPVQLQTTVVKPQAIEAISRLPKNQPRSGVTILAFSSYPNGFPVLDLDEKIAKKMVEKALPSVSVEEKRLLFGRTKWQGRTVGAVVYPISEQDIRQVQNIMNDSRLSDYERNMKVNDYMPTVMAKDTGATRIFDIQRDKLLGIQEAEDLSKVGHVALTDAKKQAEKITAIEGAASTQAVKEKEGDVKTILGDEKHRKKWSDFRQQLLRATTQPTFSSKNNTSTVAYAAPTSSFNRPALVLPTISLSTMMPIGSAVPIKEALSNIRPLARLDRWEQILGMRNGEPQVYRDVHEDSSTANDNEDASDIESCKRSIITPSIPLLNTKEIQNQQTPIQLPSPKPSLVGKPVANTQANQPEYEPNKLFSTVTALPTTVPIDFYAVPAF